MGLLACPDTTPASNPPRVALVHLIPGTLDEKNTHVATLGFWFRTFHQSYSPWLVYQST